jgi:hypothetical protein
MSPGEADTSERFVEDRGADYDGYDFGERGHG